MQQNITILLTLFKVDTFILRKHGFQVVIRPISGSETLDFAVWKPCFQTVIWWGSENTANAIKNCIFMHCFGLSSKHNINKKVSPKEQISIYKKESFQRIILCTKVVSPEIGLETRPIIGTVSPLLYQLSYGTNKHKKRVTLMSNSI